MRYGSHHIDKQQDDTHDHYISKICILNEAIMTDKIVLNLVMHAHIHLSPQF